MRQHSPDESSDMIIVDIPFEFYLKGRDEPVVIPTSFQIRKDMLHDAGDELQDFMMICLQTILSIIDTVSEHRLVLSDRYFNKAVILTDDIQAVSLLAPAEETVLRAIRTGDSHDSHE